VIEAAGVIIIINREDETYGRLDYKSGEYLHDVYGGRLPILYGRGSELTTLKCGTWVTKTVFQNGSDVVIIGEKKGRFSKTSKIHVCTGEKSLDLKLKGISPKEVTSRCSDGKRVCLGMEDGTLRLYEITDKKLVEKEIINSQSGKHIQRVSLIGQRLLFTTAHRLMQFAEGQVSLVQPDTYVFSAFGDERVSRSADGSAVLLISNPGEVVDPHGHFFPPYVSNWPKPASTYTVFSDTEGCQPYSLPTPLATFTEDPSDILAPHIVSTQWTASAHQKGTVHAWNVRSKQVALIDSIGQRKIQGIGSSGNGTFCTIYGADPVEEGSKPMIVIRKFHEE